MSAHGVTGFAQVSSIYSQNYHPVTDAWESVPIASHLSFCTKGIPARSCRIHCFKKRRKTFSLGRRCPSGRMRGGGKCSTPALTHRLRRSPLSRRAGVILWMMDSATPPCGFAQNDGIAGDIQVSYRNEGSLQSFTCEAVSTHLTLTVCEEHDDRAEKYVIESFPSSCSGLRAAFKSPAREGRDTSCLLYTSPSPRDSV